MFIEEGDQIVSKTYMTRVEGVLTRLRHYLARLHRQTLCYSLVSRDVDLFAPFAASLLEGSDSSSTSLIHYSFSNAQKCLRQKVKFRHIPQVSELQHEFYPLAIALYIKLICSQVYYRGFIWADVILLPKPN